MNPEPGQSSARPKPNPHPPSPKPRRLALVACDAETETAVRQALDSNGSTVEIFPRLRDALDRLPNSKPTVVLLGAPRPDTVRKLSLRCPEFLEIVACRLAGHELPGVPAC